MSRRLVGVVGLLTLVLVVVGALRFASLPLIGRGDPMRAEFAEAGGLGSGDAVVVSGARVGRVEDVRLDGASVEVSFTLDDDLDLGATTSARIVTVTLLGEAALELVPSGTGELDRSVPIPVGRTSSPYDITSALDELTTRTDDIDVDQLAASLDQVSRTFRDTPGDLGPALDGLSRLAATVGDNDALLRDVLARADRVSGVLADRNADVTTLLTSGQQVLAELQARRDLVERLLGHVTDLSRAVRTVVGENDAAVGPALDQLDRVVRLLLRDKRDLQRALDGIRNYAIGFGEAVSSGPFFDAYVQNLTAPGTLAPIISGAVP